MENMFVRQEESALVSDFYKLGLLYIKKGDYDRAIESFSEAIHLTPDNAEIYWQRGLAYSKKKESFGAIADFDTAIRLNPNFAKVYNSRGWEYGRRGDTDRAIADYTQAIRLDPDYEVAYRNRGIVYTKRNDIDRAIADYNQVIRLNPNNIVAYNNRGIMHAMKNDFDRAIADYTEAIRLDPNQTVARESGCRTSYDARGVAYLKKGDNDRAISDFEAALRINPNDDGVKQYLEDARQAGKLENTNHKLRAKEYFGEGLAYGKKGNHNQAIACCNEAILLDPNYAKAYYLCGAQKGDPDNAIKNFISTLEIQPDFTDALHDRGLSYSQKRDYDNAIKDFNKIIELNHNDADTYQNRGNAYLGKGDYVGAMRDCSKAIELAPDYAVAYFTRGLAFVGAKLFDMAIADFNDVIRLSPSGDPTAAIAAHWREKAIVECGNDRDQYMSDEEMAQYLDERAFRLHVLIESHFLGKGDECTIQDADDKIFGGQSWLALGLDCNVNGNRFWVSVRGHMSRLQLRDPRRIARYLEDDYKLETEMLDNGDIIAYYSRPPSEIIDEVIYICKSTAL